MPHPIESLYALDFETTGLEAWTPDFRVLSVAVSKFQGDPVDDQMSSLFVQGEDTVRELLQRLAEAQVPVIVYNVGFESMVMKCRFPEIKLNIVCDVMRLVQLYGKVNEMRPGFGLDAAIERILPHLAGHKKRFYDHLYQKVVGDTGKAVEEVWVDDLNGSETLGMVVLSDGTRRFLEDDECDPMHEHPEGYVEFPGRWELKAVEGKSKQKKISSKRLMEHIHLADFTEVRDYNVSDTETTLRLYKRIVADFFFQRYDWEPDHELYLFMANQIVESQIRGVRVDRDAALKYVGQIEQELADLDNAFRAEYAGPIESARDLIHAKEQAKFKKKKVERPEFNITSKTHLERLCVEVLGLARLTHMKKRDDKTGEEGMVPTWFRINEKGEHFAELLVTPTNKPSFKSAHMHQWGRVGEMIQSRGKRIIVKTQATSLARLSEPDGKWHLGLRLAGTVTGRYAGGGGLNCQGLSRRDEGLMSTILPSAEGMSLISIDCASGEPTVTSEFTRDKVYTYCAFEGVGKSPYYDRDILMCDDIYLTGMSFSPFGASALQEAFEADWEGKTFQEQWVINKEVIQKGKRLKKLRDIHKMSILAIAYGAGAPKIHRAVNEAGFPVKFEAVQKFWYRYWDVFSGLKAFADKQKQIAEKQGYIITPLGYRVTPDPHKAFNATIQSSINPIMQQFTKCLVEEAPYAQFVTIIHDEIIIECPTDRVEDCRQAKERAQTRLNEWLKWSLNMRMGWAVGHDWYTAK